MKICCVSDTHRSHWDLKIPKCDIFIHSGDNDITDIDSLNDFNNWLGEIEVKYTKIIIAGNHDFFYERIKKDWCKQLLTNTIYLENEYTEVAGLKFWGSPYTPKFYNWAFMQKRQGEELKNNWSQIPENLDFLITHGPAYGLLDQNQHLEHCGCELLQKEIVKKKPKYHIFGHIHEGYGKFKTKDTTFINCSVLNEHYELTNKPIIIEV